MQSWDKALLHNLDVEELAMQEKQLLQGGNWLSDHPWLVCTTIALSSFFLGFGANKLFLKKSAIQTPSAQELDYERKAFRTLSLGDTQYQVPFGVFCHVEELTRKIATQGKNINDLTQQVANLQESAYIKTNNELKSQLQATGYKLNHEIHLKNEYIKLYETKTNYYGAIINKLIDTLEESRNTKLPITEGPVDYDGKPMPPKKINTTCGPEVLYSYGEYKVGFPSMYLELAKERSSKTESS